MELCAWGALIWRGGQADLPLTLLSLIQAAFGHPPVIHSLGVSARSPSPPTPADTSKVGSPLEPGLHIAWGHSALATYFGAEGLLFMWWRRVSLSTRRQHLQDCGTWCGGQGRDQQPGLALCWVQDARKTPALPLASRRRETPQQLDKRTCGWAGGCCRGAREAGRTLDRWGG